MALPGKRRFWKLSGFLCLGVIVYFKLIPLTWYWFATSSQEAEWAEKGLWLPGYRVGIEAKPLAGIDDNASGLTYSAATGTLFSVINRPPQVVELSTEGDVLRILPIEGLRDPEGITHVGEDLFIIADERENQLHWVRIRPRDRGISVVSGPRFALGTGMMGNVGMEGVTWDHAGGQLFFVKEKFPLRIIQMTGLAELLDGGELNLSMREWKSWLDPSLFMSDLSSLSFHEPTGNLLVLSDESALLVEYAPDGQPVSIMPLWPGAHGLSRRVPQAEGVTVGPEGEIFILSEPNLFYRFERQSPAPWLLPEVLSESELLGRASDS